jgi:hypothetical protein
MRNKTSRNSGLRYRHEARHSAGCHFRLAPSVGISEATGIGNTVVGEYVRRTGVIGVTWPVPEEMFPSAEGERITSEALRPNLCC